MQTIQSRIYTNVILTIIAIFLGALALQPVLSISSPAFAQRASDKNLQQRRAFEQSILESSTAAAPRKWLRDRPQRYPPLAAASPIAAGRDPRR